MSAVIHDLESEYRDRVSGIIGLLLQEGQSLAVVDSPPGAGKTWLVEHVVALAVHHAGMRVCCVTPRVAQGYDLARRIADNFDLPCLEVLAARDREPPEGLRERARVVQRPQELRGDTGVVVTNAHKLAIHADYDPAPEFDLMVVDEAYQLAYKDFLPIAHLADRVLLVGDPGQLAPLVTVDTTRFEGAEQKVHWALPRAVLDKHPEAPVRQLPATRRLPPDTAELVREAFYPELPFASLVAPDERRIELTVAGMGGGLDRALDLIEAGSSLVALVLPERETTFEEYDAELAGTMADLVVRFLERGPRDASGRLLGEADLGCIDPHVVPGEAIRHRLRNHEVGNVWVNTPEQWQGLERAVTIVRHPLSDAAGASGFDFDAGRWCVSVSRHTHACIIVGRAHINDVLEAYVHDCSTIPTGARDELWRGYKGHAVVWEGLRARGRLVASAP